MANVVLRTSHQAHIYNECDIEATGGDSVDLRKGIVYIRMTFFCCLFSQLYLRLILNIGMLLKIGLTGNPAPAFPKRALTWMCHEYSILDQTGSAA